MEKELNRTVVVIILIVVCCCKMLSQIKTDTVNLGKNSIVFFYPQKSKISITNYEEGFFKDICCIEDTALIGLHYGSMVAIPLIGRKDNNIISEYILANDLRQTRGFYIFNGKKKYFREDNVYKYGFSLYYTNVSEEKIGFYEMLLNSLKYMVGEIGGSR